MQAFFVKVLLEVLTDERIQNWIKNMITVAVASATKSVVDKVPGIEMIGNAADVATDIRTDLDRLIPDFDTGIKPIDDILDIWRPR